MDRFETSSKDSKKIREALNVLSFCFYSSISQSDPVGEHSVIASSRLFALIITT